MTVTGFNQLDRDAAVELLESCCASTGWATRVADARPFDDLEGLLAAAERLGRSGGRERSRRSRPPPIEALAAATARERHEQAGARRAGRSAREALGALNEDYGELRIRLHP